MAELFERRMNAAKDVAEYKKENGLPIFDASREEEVIKRNSAYIGNDDIKAHYVNFLKNTMNVSKDYQRKLLRGMKIAYSGVEGAFGYIAAKKLFPDYEEEEFLMMYGMLTGTASTGTILLREVDGEFRTPAADNMVYQNFPAIVFGFPLMLLANLAPEKPELTLAILIVFFIVMNIILFRSFIFKKKNKKAQKTEETHV